MTMIVELIRWRNIIYRRLLVNYNMIFRRIAAIGNVAWNVSNGQANNGSISLHYQDAGNRIFSVGYNFVRDGDNVFGDPSGNLSRINLAAAWPISDRWSFVGNWNYNITYTHPETYFYGLEYDSCCWAIRVVQGYNYNSTAENGSEQYRELSMCSSY